MEDEPAATVRDAEGIRLEIHEKSRDALAAKLDEAFIRERGRPSLPSNVTEVAGKSLRKNLDDLEPLVLLGPGLRGTQVEQKPASPVEMPQRPGEAPRQRPDEVGVRTVSLKNQVNRIKRSTLRSQSSGSDTIPGVKHRKGCFQISLHLSERCVEKELVASIYFAFAARPDLFQRAAKRPRQNEPNDGEGSHHRRPTLHRSGTP
mmetsp:Transcript_52382/g.157190  ORF Transcript_52382/g.157190 Transcript_52382/m.157190 type:complete len:204 (-) Transcript_52382:397-1008(-)